MIDIINNWLNENFFWLGLSCLLLLVILTWREERKKWNGGVCKETNKPWVYLMTTRTSSTIYTCDNHTLEIRLPFTRMNV